MTLSEAKAELHKYASISKAKILRSFFKTGPGEYGEGDVFIGVKVPEARKVAKKFDHLPIADTLELLCSDIHEERLLALFLLMSRYNKSDPAAKKYVIGLYLKHTRYINNWDLVDLSAPKILGHWLLSKENLSDRSLLYTLAKSRNMWERRIAIVATYAFIRENQFTETFRIADILARDPEDLLHKAVGWMLREVGKRDVLALEEFMHPRYKTMPRTMLRYAIEKFPSCKRQRYLQGRI